MHAAIAGLAITTVFIALVSEVFVESVQHAAEQLGMSPAFVGFVVVALVGGAAEALTAFSAARKNRLDLSVGIAMGSSAQIALFVAPVLVLASHFIAPSPMDLGFSPGHVVAVFVAVLAAALAAGFRQLRVVQRRAAGRGVWRLRHYPVPASRSDVRARCCGA